MLINNPDCNSIESFWAIMKRKVESICPQTKEDLINAWVSVWEKITEESIHNLIKSIKDRLQNVIANNCDELKLIDKYCYFKFIGNFLIRLN